VTQPHHVQTLDQAMSVIREIQPDLICLSTTYSPLTSLRFLTQLKDSFTTKIIPLLFVIDWSERIHRVLGTEWGGKIGVLHSANSTEEISATLKRIALPQ
jgi:DNA-binding response OmpR family regulator